MRAAHKIIGLIRKLSFPFFLFLCLAPAIQSVAKGNTVYVLNVAGAISPASNDYIHRGLQEAQNQGAELLVLRMDTPGGLDQSMRSIVRDILASSVPVATYVAPSGARAASAGTYILYASHVVAMAPGTNLGAATPVAIGGLPEIPEAPGQNEGKQGTKPDINEDPMNRKMVNDASAYIRGLAEMRDRNADWAEKAVREAASLTAEEALKENVIDLIATDMPELLKKMNGLKVSVQNREVELNTKDSSIVSFEADWKNKLLSIITDPNIAYILMLAGIYGMIFEFANPGYVLPGVVGAICLILALYAFQVLPINYAGLGLILLGILFMTGEAFMPSFGALGIGGAIAFIIGSLILFDNDMGGYTLSYALIGSFTLLSAGFLIGFLGAAINARHRPIVCGREELVGMTGTINEDFTGDGSMHIHGENWQVFSAVPLKKGAKATVTRINGLTLEVKPEKDSNNP